MTSVCFEDKQPGELFITMDQGRFDHRRLMDGIARSPASRLQ